ncbi:helix-turn-helix transcriptional regulator [Devosia sp. 1566]|uniref:helix-turn-helix transcriptional regulator n=1 Tax=Devosia sp. 1566 TaxID=2499144 RepID=UPI000FD96103|nr:helix-turn-helix transcriptional regulator [Devosia sp. 1566]
MTAKFVAADSAERRPLSAGMDGAGDAMSLSNSDAEELSALLDTVYDAAIERATWIEALQQACRFLRCSAGAVLSADLLGTFGLSVHWGYGPGCWESYRDRYFHLDPLNSWVFRSRIGGVFIGSHSVLWPEVLASTYYREWVAPQGFIDLIGATLDKSASGVAALTCIRRHEDGLADDSCAWRMRLILPHFRRALLISKLLDQHDLRPDAFVEAMDALSTSVFFLNAAGELVHSNQSGREILAAGQPLGLIGKSLAATHQPSQIELRRALNAVLNSKLESSVERVALSISGANGEPYATHLLPLTSGARRQVGMSTAAVAAVFVRETSIDVGSAISAATKLYKFTPAECRVLAEIVDHGGLEHIATRLGVTRRTVQTHLEHLFEKTGSKRQADLVKLVAGHQSPLHHSN